MLYEIICDEFISHGKKRGRIVFNSGLNIVQGHNTGTNSIGKSSFLLAVDFAFGGEDYAKDNRIINHIGHHIIKFCFIFDKPYFFSRSTENKNVVNICNENYTILEEKSIAEYSSFLFNCYNINLDNISFRNIVSRYFRIYGRDNANEKSPLALFRAEAQEESLSALLKLYNLYKPICPLYADLQKLKKKKEAITKQQYVKIIKKKTYKENIRRLEELKLQLDYLTNYGRDELLAVDPEKAEKIAEKKSCLDNLNRQKKRLWYQYYNIKNAREYRRPATTQEFEELLKYFPNSNLPHIKEVESFHSSLIEILEEEFASEMSSILAHINEISISIDNVETFMNEINLPQKISEHTLKTYASISKQIDAIQEENIIYTKKKNLENNIKISNQNYINVFMKQIAMLQNIVNEKMAELNAYIYGPENIPPILNVLKPNSYEFGTITDGGTGTNCKNLILLDLSTLMLTMLPALAHDTVIFKHIGQIPMGKIIELYSRNDKQIFIAIDETTKYPVEAQKIVTERTVIQLSENGNELYGESWVKKAIKGNEV